MSESLIYFTDRLPSDSDPFSYWVWKEFEGRARSGFEVHVYLLNATKEALPEELPPRLHLRSALRGHSFLRWAPFIQSLLSTPVRSLCLIEPKKPSLSLLPLLFIPQMRRMGMISSELSYLAFSGTLSQNWALPTWVQECDLVRFSHPSFSVQKLSAKTKWEEIRLDPALFADVPPHWSLQTEGSLSLIPGSLKDLIREKVFWNQAVETLTRDVLRRFVFLEGFGGASPEEKKRFLSGPLAAHFVFPEPLSGAQMGQALFSGADLLTDFVAPSSALAGLALKILLERNHRQLEEQKVYGLL